MYKVILVDDEPWILEGLKRIIQWKDFDFEIINSVSDTNDALDAILKLHPDVVITDIRMPQLSGIDIVKIIRDLDMQTEVVFISGMADFSYAKDGIKYGVFDYLLKPIKKEDIETLLTKLSDKLKRNKENEENDLREYLLDNKNVSKTLQKVNIEYELAIVINKDVKTKLYKLKIGKNKYLILKNHSDNFDFCTDNISMGVSTGNGSIANKYNEADIAFENSLLYNVKKVSYKKCDVVGVNSILLENFYSPDINKIQNIIAFLQQLPQLFEKNGYMLSEVVYFYNQIVSIIKKNHWKIIEDIDLDFMNYQQFINNFENFDAVCEYFSQLYLMISDSVQMPIEHEVFKKIIDYIDNHYEEKLYLKELAQKFYLNSAYCCQLFKKILGKTFSDYLTTVRLEEAKRLLLTTNMTIEDIAVKTGYNDYYYFIKVFKKNFFCTPTQFKKKNNFI